MLDPAWLGIWIGVAGVIVGLLQLPALQRWLERKRANQGQNASALLGDVPKDGSPRVGLQDQSDPDNADPLPDIKGALAMLPKVTFDPAKATELPWVAQLEADYYKEHAVPLVTLERWFNTNPCGFFIIRVAGNRVGHATLLPLRDEAIKALVDGKISEKDLRESDLWTPAERDRVRSVYIESIVADSKALKCQVHQRLLVQFLEQLHRLIGCVANPRKIDCLYAYPATPRGVAALDELGFEKLPRAESSALPTIYARRYRDLRSSLRHRPAS